MDHQKPNIRVRINQIDYVLQPAGALDNSNVLPRVPVIRIYGTSSIGRKACVHVHQVYPYFFLEYAGKMDPEHGAYHVPTKPLAPDVLRSQSAYLSINSVFEPCNCCISEKESNLSKFPVRASYHPCERSSLLRVSFGLFPFPQGSNRGPSHVQPRSHPTPSWNYHEDSIPNIRKSSELHPTIHE